jgi:RND family efflux transporter MFP subunit
MTLVPVTRRPLPVSIAVALLLALSACSKSEAEAPAATVVPDVLTAQARAADAEFTMTLPARALAGETAQIYPRATGFVSERRVDLGDAVQAGQVLAVIANPEADQTVRESQAEVVRARSAVALAQVNYERAAALVESGAISRELYSDRSANRDAAQAALAATQARLDSARERQGFQQVRAPFAGVIAARNVDRGDRVVGDAAAATPLFELNALDPLRILVDVPQGAALQVRPGLKAGVTFPELPGQRFDAEIVRSAQSISDEAGGMRVELRLPNPEHRIPAGMVGQVSLQVPRAAPAVIVPLSAISGPAGRSRVARVGADSTIDFRPVLLGRDLGGDVEVLDGLAVGDRVVLAPNALLQAGTRVAVKTPPPAKAP